MVVLDTSALLFWTLDNKRLSTTARQVIANTEQIIISSISIWEIGLKVKRGKLDFPVSVSEYARRLKSLRHVEIYPVDENMWLENVALNWGHRDPADRTIVATAKLLDVPLLTSDRAILAFYEQAIW